MKAMSGSEPNHDSDAVCIHPDVNSGTDTMEMVQVVVMIDI